MVPRSPPAPSRATPLHNKSVVWPSQVLQALRASSYVPGWSGKEPSITFRGAPAFDGVFSQYVPCHDKATFCIKVRRLEPPKGGVAAAHEWVVDAQAVVPPPGPLCPKTARMHTTKA